MDDGGILVEGYESISKVGVKHFETLFQEDQNLHLPKIMQIGDNFPTSISVEENDDLMCPVSLTEIQSILSVCKKDKSSRPDVIPVEVYMSLFDVLGLDLLRVVDDSRKC